MSKNKWVWAIAAALVLVGLVIGNILSNQKKPMRRKPDTARQKSIPIITVQKPGPVRAKVQILVRQNRIDLRSSLPGG
jgi:hypothetical protein